MPPVQVYPSDPMGQPVTVVSAMHAGVGGVADVLQQYARVVPSGSVVPAPHVSAALPCIGEVHPVHE
jgi:hypothetical protein